MIPIIDLFAGPGGLNEGFSQLGEAEGQPVFKTIGSFEMESSACSTLRLRGAYRTLLRDGDVPEAYYSFIRGQIDWERFQRSPRVAQALQHSATEVHQIELGLDQSESDRIIRESLATHGVGPGSPWVLIGGPPCQAYSLAGRSRRANDLEFENDKKHFLYREYLHIIAEFAPPVFVMENVKGLLSSTNSGEGMFAKIKRDLQHPRDGLAYEIHSLTVAGDVDDLSPADFIIRAERHGVPQKRHRVILLGIRKGAFPDGLEVNKLTERPPVDVQAAIGNLPRLRSGISPAQRDNAEDWYALRRQAETSFASDGRASSNDVHRAGRGGAFVAKALNAPRDAQYAEWIADARIGGAVQHATRSHMPEDLARYSYAAIRAEEAGVSPKLRDFPETLLPNHKNATSKLRPFEDRFRVQVWGQPSSTVVSHIAKDGHYFIHPDPSQMRSLTVREAARLQSFPDNYFFMGSRTQQYHQVGNAVPPLLANQIARIVSEFLYAS